VIPKKNKRNPGNSPKQKITGLPCKVVNKNSDLALQMHQALEA
jgi:hypothetical protein